MRHFLTLRRLALKTSLLFCIYAFGNSYAFAKICNCPNDVDAKGKKCGELSDFCNPSGNEPKCGTHSVGEIKVMFKNLCPKSYEKIKRLVNIIDNG